jgi:SAM-dependent methyltransferase
MASGSEREIANGRLEVALGVTIESPGYFDLLADFESRHWWSRGVWKLASYWLDDALRGREGLAALDVGCGAGTTAVRLSARPEISRIVGLDPNRSALAHARRRHRFPLVIASALDLPFDDGRFDLVTCLDVLQHLPDGGDRRAASEIARVLAPRGLVLIRSNGRGFSRDRSGYTLAQLFDVLTRAGFRILRASYVNCAASLAQELRGGFSRGRSSRHPAGGGLQVRFPNPALERVAGAIVSTEAVLAGRLGVKLPFGHSTMVFALLEG